MPYNCLYLNKGNNSSVKGSILTKLIGYQESMVLIICTKNELNLTNRYWDMVPDRQKVRTDGRTDGMDGPTDGRRQNYIPPTSSGDNNSPSKSYCIKLDMDIPCIKKGFYWVKKEKEHYCHLKPFIQNDILLIRRHKVERIIEMPFA